MTAIPGRIERWRAIQSIRRAGFWFVDVPRTSSTAIRTELGTRFGRAYGKDRFRDKDAPQIFQDHIPAAKMRAVIGPRAWDRLLSFTIVRNPWDRFLSLYHFRQKRGVIPAEWSFAEYVARLVEADAATPYFQFHGQRLGAADYVRDESGAVIVTEIIRFEARDEGLARIGERIGYPQLGAERLNAAKPTGQSYREVYDDRSRELIASRYADDLALFGYAF